MSPLKTSYKQEVQCHKRLVQLDRGEAEDNNKCFIELVLCLLEYIALYLLAFPAFATVTYFVTLIDSE